MRRLTAIGVAVYVALVSTSPAAAQAPQPAVDATELAKSSQNPVGDVGPAFSIPSAADVTKTWTVPLGIGISKDHGVQRPPEEPRRAVLLQRQAARRHGGYAAPLSRHAALSDRQEVITRCDCHAWEH